MKGYLKYLYWTAAAKSVGMLFEPLQYLFELLEAKALTQLNELREKYRTRAAQARSLD